MEGPFAPPFDNRFLSVGATINGLGDSITAQGGYNLPGNAGTLFSLKTGRMYLAWAEWYSKGTLNFDLSKGYGGTLGGVLKVWVVAGGINYVNGDTIAFTGAGLTGASGTLVISGGVITGVTGIVPGSGASAPIGYTITTSTGSGAILRVVQGGSGTFGVGGDDTVGMVARLPDVVASGINICVVHGGTNDANAGVAASVIIANLKICYETLMRAGIRLIIMPILPRQFNSSNAIQWTILRVNRWIRAYCRGEIWANPDKFTSNALADVSMFFVDGTNANGYPIGGLGGGVASMLNDGLHPTQRGAAYMGYVIAMAATKFIQNTPTQPVRIYSQFDKYDATNNPSGWLYPSTANFSPFFTGTGGTQLSAGGGIIYSGTMPAGYTIQRLAGTATGTVDTTIENPWSDGHIGQRLKITFSLGGGTTSERWSITAAGQTLAQLNIAVADWLVCEAEVQIVNQLCMTNCYATWAEATTGFGVFAGPYQADYLINSTGIDTITLPDKWLLRTNREQVPASATSISWAVKFAWDASGAAGSAQAVVYLNLLSLLRDQPAV